MNSYIEKIYLRHTHFWKKDTFLLFLGAVALLAAALLVQHFAYNYVDHHAQVTYVGDLLLDNLPTINLDFFIVQGALILSFVVMMLCAIQPRYLLFSIKSLAFFIIVRSFFISLTHLGVSLHQITLNAQGVGFSIYDFLYNAKNDFFFSGHVGAPFLFGLIFWKEALWRNFFFVAAGIFGVTMILAHMHYSIDVFAAPFITYSIFIISKKIFNKEYQLIRE